MEQKVPVVILGCTGAVGQRFILLLQNHPWFKISALGASEKHHGRPFAECVDWKMSDSIPNSVKHLPVHDASSVESFMLTGARVAFSALDTAIATLVEPNFAKAGFAVFSNASSYRMAPDIPILIPHANPEHLELIHHQRKARQWKGYIVTNANCSSTGLVVPLRALKDKFGIDSLHVVTMQAVSGAGLTGVSGFSIMDNVIPFIGSEEEKLQTEPLKILGSLTPSGERIEAAQFVVSAQCNRVPVLDGHTECVSVKLKTPATPDEVAEAFRSYRPPNEGDVTKLPSTPAAPIFVSEERDRPQPRLDRDRGNGFVVSVGCIQPCPLMHIKFVLLSHNTILGAAGGSIQNAELAHVKGLLPTAQ